MQNTTQVIVWTTFACPSCGITCAYQDSYVAERQKDGARFYCPNGHWLTYGKTELDKAKESLAREQRLRGSAEARVTHLRDQLEATDRSRAAYKGQITRIKNRVSRGVCPCCNRHFADLGAHMAGKHPDWTPDAHG